jgi:hypothetical protein
VGAVLYQRAGSSTWSIGTPSRSSAETNSAKLSRPSRSLDEHARAIGRSLVLHETRTNMLQRRTTCCNVHGRTRPRECDMRARVL